ncbi:uncharacterized protein LOC135820053 [Sycon ciliatum]|uniref:uncharacterized protein LOC135820053 n=1 Tax=Sycon ciliatum TaxID=27933 RepID=UPI0031F63959
MARASQVLLLTSTLMLTCWTGLSMAFSTGAPASTCSSMAPSHGSSKSQAGSQGCMLAFSGSVQEGRSQTLSLTCGGNPFKGFIVQCRTGDENGAAVGEFTAAGTHTAHRSCNAGQNNAVTHTSGAAKTQVELGWTPDQTACQADIQCRATVVFQYATFTTHVRAASTRCAAAPVASTKPAPAEQPTPAEVFSAMPDSASGEITEDAGNSNPTLGTGSQEGEVLSPMSVPSSMDDESDEQIIQDVQGAIVKSPEDAGNSNPTLGSGSQEGEVLSPMSVPSSMDDESDAQIIQDMQGAIEKSPAEQPTPAVIFSAVPGSGSQEGEVLSPMSVPSSMDDESDAQIIQDMQGAIEKSPAEQPTPAVIFSAMPGSGSQEGEVLSPMSVPSSMDDESDEQIIQDVQRAVAKSPGKVESATHLSQVVRSNGS